MPANFPSRLVSLGPRTGAGGSQSLDSTDTEALPMDRRNGWKLAACGLGLLISTTGCKSLMTRREIPPEPPGASEARPAAFGSGGHTSTIGPASPTGPVGASPYGPLGNYAPGGRDPGGMPSGAPADGGGVSAGGAGGVPSFGGGAPSAGPADMTGANPPL